MPYIKQAERMPLEITQHAKTPGELNYLLTMTCLDYVSRHGRSYDTLNAVVGVLESVKLEFNRRLVAPYEDEKISLNGDIEGYER